MKKTKLFCVILLVSQFLSCTTSRKNSNYHRKVNQALAYYIDSNYVKSARLYKKAFRIKEGYADDIFNALLNAQALQDSVLSYSYAKALAKKGACTELFNTFPIIASNKGYLMQLNLLYKNRVHNTYYRNQLGLIANRDQNVRTGTIRYSRDAYITDSTNRAQFVSLVKQFGYPSEEVIGVTCAPSYTGLNPEPQNIFLWHFAKNDWVEKEIFDSAFSKGLLSPQYYIQYMGVYQNDYLEVLPELVYWINDGYFIPKIDTKTKRRVNKNRKKLGLPSIDMEIKIVKHKIMNSNCRVRGNWTFSGYEMPDSIVNLKFQPLNLK